jgi:hypothetical protein
MGCREISVWPNGLLWNICITQRVVMKYLYYPMGCYEKSIWPNELLWNIRITQWVVMKYLYDQMGCYEIFVLPDGLLWNLCITRWVVMKNPYDLMSCYEIHIHLYELMSWITLIAAAKWKQVFGSKAHLCRAHLACWFSAASESKHYFALALTDLLGLLSYCDTCWCPNCKSNSCHTLKKEIMRW